MANHANIADLFDDIAVKIQDKTGNHDDTIVADNFPAAIENIAIPLILTPRDITVQTSASTTATYASNDNIRIRDNEGNDHTLAEWNRLFADAGFDKDNMSVQPVGIRVQAADVDEVYLFDRYTGVTYNPSGEAAGVAGKLQHSLQHHNFVTAVGSGTDSTTNKGWSVVADGDNLILNEENTGQSWVIAKNTGPIDRYRAFNTADRVQSIWAQNEWMRHRMAIDSGLTTSEADGTMASVQILNSSGAQAAVGEDMYFWIGGTNTNILAKYNLNNRHNISGYYLTQAIADAIYAAQIAQGVNMNDTGVNSVSKPVLAPGSKGAEAIAVGGKWYIITPYISNPNATTSALTANIADSPVIYWAMDSGRAVLSDALATVIYQNKDLCNAIISYLNTVEQRGLPVLPSADFAWSATRITVNSGWCASLNNGTISTASVYSRYYACPALPSAPQPAIEEEFISKTAQHSGPAKLLKVYGKSIVWNQQVQEFSVAETTSAGATFAIVRSTLEIVAAGGTDNITIFTNLLNEGLLGFRQVTGHKYYSPNTLPQGVYFSQNVYGGGFAPCSGIIQEGLFNSNQQQWSLKAPIGTVIPAKEYCQIIVIDLTLLYGAGNEPTSVAQFLADYPTFDPTYDPGSLQSNKTAELRAERIPVINVWDEEWEVGSISSTTGINDDSQANNVFRTKNYIPVFPGMTYFFKVGAPSLPSNVMLPRYYDENKNYIGYVDANGYGNGANLERTIPTNARYIRFGIGKSLYGAQTYQNNICINLSDPAINGQYFPHWRGSLSLNLSTLTGKLNGEGASVVVCPEGLMQAGSVRDEAIVENGYITKIVKRIGVVDLGTLDWTLSNGVFVSDTISDIEAGSAAVVPNIINTKYTAVSYSEIADKQISISTSRKIWVKDSAYTDPATFKAAMSGIMLDYPLATPLTYTLDTPLPTNFDVRAGDKMIAESDNNCPFVGDIVYKV